MNTKYRYNNKRIIGIFVDMNVSKPNGYRDCKNLTYTVKTKPKELLIILKEKIKNQSDIKFTGNEKSGWMKGKGFEGEYAMSESLSSTAISLTITKKPIIIPWAIIKSKMDAEAKK